MEDITGKLSPEQQMSGTLSAIPSMYGAMTNADRGPKGDPGDPGPQGPPGPKGDPGDSVDVRINGTSIVQDGIADIPKASNTTLGVIRTSTTYATRINADGVLQIYDASGVVDAFTNAYRPITPRLLPESVKAVMSATLEKVPSWTADEKAMARTRIGLDDWEELTTTETIQLLSSEYLNSDTRNNVQRTGKLVVLNIAASLKKNLPASTVGLYTLPEQFRPPHNIQFPAFTSGLETVLISVTTDGLITYGGYSSPAMTEIPSGRWIWLNASWFTA